MFVLTTVKDQNQGNIKNIIDVYEYYTNKNTKTTSN